MKPVRPYTVIGLTRTHDMWQGQPWNMKSFMVEIRVLHSQFTMSGPTRRQALTAGIRKARRITVNLVTNELQP